MSHYIPAPTGNRAVDLLAERRSVIMEREAESDSMARAILQYQIDEIDRELAAMRAARS